MPYIWPEQVESRHDAARLQEAQPFDQDQSQRCLLFFSGTAVGGGIPSGGAAIVKGGEQSPVRARGSRSQQWYAESRVQMLRKKCRTQSLWNLHLAGDWHVASETMPPRARPHMMRCMLISNLAVDQRFANGTQAFGSRSDRTGQDEAGLDQTDLTYQGRLLQWHPAATDSKRKALPAYCPDLLARFCKETSLSKAEMLPDIDHMDIGARQENLAVRGEPIMLQLCVVPAYVLGKGRNLGISEESGPDG